MAIIIIRESDLDDVVNSGICMVAAPGRLSVR